MSGEQTVQKAMGLAEIIQGDHPIVQPILFLRITLHPALFHMWGPSSWSSAEDGQVTGQFQCRVMSVAMEEAQGGRSEREAPTWSWHSGYRK